MQVVILAGGLGTRLGEITKKIPKPMVMINGIPILQRIINFYYDKGYKDFIIACGYKKNIIYKYFKELSSKNDTIILKNNNLYVYFKKKKIQINLIDTGLNTLTGGRVKKISKFITSNNFLLTYGDGLSNVSLSKLKKIHLTNNSIITISIVNPKSKYGRVKIGTKNKILKFEEKPVLKNEWINGGFMICSKKIFRYIKNTQSILEKDVFSKILKLNKLSYHKHVGFWQCMDTARDKSELEKVLR